MTWLSDDEWAKIQTLLPIAVVDIVLVAEDDHPRVGLIQRDTPHQGRRWNLIGGRIRFGEAIGEAMAREVRETLGAELHVRLPDASRPHYVAQYGPMKRGDFLDDPRKHAVGLTYVVPAWGAPVPQGEAFAFHWFPLRLLPRRDQWGFRQDRAAESSLRSAGLIPTFDD